MVQIATSRDVSYVGARSGRIAPSGPQVNVGAAVKNLGQGVVEASYNLNDLRTAEARENQTKLGYDIEQKILEFRVREEEAFNRSREEASESGIGFTRQFLEGHQQRVNAFIKSNFDGVSEAQNASGRQSLMGLGNSFYNKAYDYEQKSKLAYYDRTTNSGLDNIRTQIRGNAAPFDELKRQGLAAIDSADMPEPWKAERRAMWDSDAAESKWRWKFEQNPQQAISDLKPSGAKSLLRKEEGFRAEPYWDVNAWRIGYGSDTITLPDGTQQAVKPGMKISREDAERDLEYRLREREGAQARKQIGDQWGGLNVNVQSALTSVAYNYGSLPSTVVNAVKTGDNNAIADAVANLSANPERRKREAALIRGQGSIKIEDEYAGLSYDRRDQLAKWGETEYSQQVNQQRAAAKDRYSLLIATEPQNISQSVIMSDGMLDDGDKATLINSLNTAMKDKGAADALISALSRGSVSINPFDADQRKVADSAYERLLGASQTPEAQQAVTNDFVTRTGYIPKPVQAELRKGAYSTDAGLMAQSMEAGLTLSRLTPAGFQFDGSADIQKKMDVYRALTRDLGYSPDEAAKKLIAANDPELVKNRDALIKSEVVSKELKAVDASVVASVFDKGFWHSAPSLGVNPAAEAAMVADYKSLLEESIVDANGDLEAAKKAASDRMHRIYGASEFSTLGNTVIRYPIEKAYPIGTDGSHAWVRAQVIEALAGEGIQTDDVYLMPMADGTTDKDIRAAKPARYQVFYKDMDRGTIESLNVPFYADVEVERKRVDEETRKRAAESEQRMIDNRSKDEATGVMRETFANDKEYRGAARVGSPMERAMHGNTQRNAEQVERNRQHGEEFLQQIDKGAESSKRFLNSITPTVKIGGYTFGGDK